jgi:hypothetical protein
MGLIDFQAVSFQTNERPPKKTTHKNGGLSIKTKDKPPPGRQ